MPNGHEMSVETVEQWLEESDEFSAFSFSFKIGDGVPKTTMGNQPARGDPNYIELIADQISTIADESNIHPAVVGHAATEIALRKPDSMVFNYDEYLENLEEE